MGSLYVSQELRVDGYAGFGGVGDVLYAAKATGDALVTGDLSVGGDLDVTGNITGTVVVTHPLPMSCLEGCAVSNAADAAHDITITKGRRRDSTNTVNIVLSAATTKRIDAAWSAGTGNGGLDTGAVGNSTPYYVYLIADATGCATVDVIISAAAPATGPALPAGYTLFREIGAAMTDGSANILPGTWSEGNQVFEFTTQIVVRAYGVVTTGSRQTVTAALPPLAVAEIYALGAANSGTSLYLLGPLTDSDHAPIGLNDCDLAVLSAYAQVIKNIRLNSSSQFCFREAGGVNPNLALNCRKYWLPLGAYDYP